MSLKIIVLLYTIALIKGMENNNNIPVNYNNQGFYYPPMFFYQFPNNFNPPINQKYNIENVQNNNPDLIEQEE